MEEEILEHLSKHPKEKLENLKPGDIWVELGDSVRAIKKRLLRDRPSLGEEGALEEARRLYRERINHG